MFPSVVSHMCTLTCRCVLWYRVFRVTFEGGSAQTTRFKVIQFRALTWIIALHIRAFCVPTNRSFFVEQRQVRCCLLHLLYQWRVAELPDVRPPSFENQHLFLTRVLGRTNGVQMLIEKRAAKPVKESAFEVMCPFSGADDGIIWSEIFHLPRPFHLCFLAGEDASPTQSIRG